jgi:hypothetical protein
MLAGIPAILLLPFVTPWNQDVPRGAAEHTGEVEDDAGRTHGPARA